MLKSLISTLVALIALTGCSKELPPPTPVQQETPAKQTASADKPATDEETPREATFNPNLQPAPIVRN